MQPPNLGIDPAANLWSSNSPSANLFSSVSSPGNSNTESIVGLNSNLYPTQDIGSGLSGRDKISGRGMEMPPPPNQGSSLNPTGVGDSSAGEVFMGVSSPQPGGMPAWKWNILN